MPKIWHLLVKIITDVKKSAATDRGERESKKRKNDNEIALKIKIIYLFISIVFKWHKFPKDLYLLLLFFIFNLLIPYLIVQNYYYYLLLLYIAQNKNFIAVFLSCKIL